MCMVERKSPYRLITSRWSEYVYGREEVTIQTDHKPLECIFKKPLNTAPMRLQRMLLRLQIYNLNVRYHKGTEMYLADTQRY